MRMFFAQTGGLGVRAPGADKLMQDLVDGERRRMQAAPRAFKNQEERMTFQVRTRLGKHFFTPVSRMSLADLKKSCDFLAIRTDGFLDKSEFIRAIDERRGDACVSCGEDFAPGEELRVTACGHFGHEQCLIDWCCKSSTERGGAPICWSCRRDPFTRPAEADKVEQANVAAGRKRARGE